MGRARKTGFLLLVLLLELLLLLYNPPYHNPDELSHLQRVAHRVRTGQAPEPYALPKIQQDKHPPYTYFLSSLIVKASSGLGSEGKLRLPGPRVIERDLGRVPEGLDPPVTVGQLLLLRAFSVLHWVLLAWYLCALAELCWPDRPRFALFLALFCTLLPQAALTGASLTPDAPLSAFCVASFFFLARGALGFAGGLGLGLKAGAFLALALLSKSAAVHLLPVLLLAAWMRRRTGDGKGEASRFLLGALLPPLLFSGWWYLGNFLHYGDFFQMKAQVETFTHSVRRSPLTPAFYEVFLEDTFRTFFGFWNREILLPRPFFYLAAGLCGVAATGLLLLLSPRVREAETHLLQRRLALLGGLGLLAMGVLTFLGNLTVFSPQGRYLYPALPGILLLLGLGLRTAARLRRDGWGWHLCSALWVLFLLFSFDYCILSREAPLRSRAEGKGGVLHYQDCGVQGLRPFLVQGLDLPDEGQLGRNTPWRSLTGHPEAVVFRFPIPEKWRRDLQVRVTYFDPFPDYPYTALKEGRFPYIAQNLQANGKKLHGAIEVTSSPRSYLFPLEADLLAEGELELRFTRVSGKGACVSEIWVEEPWLVLEEKGATILLRNRSSETLPFLLLFRSPEEEGFRKGRIEPGARLPVTGLPEGILETRVLAGPRSPWSLREAEAHPGEGQRWFGDLEASGAYRVRGRGLLGVLPFPEDLPGPTLFLARLREKGGPWTFSEVKVSGGSLSFEAEEEGSLDYVLQMGGWR